MCPLFAHQAHSFVREMTIRTADYDVNRMPDNDFIFHGTELRSECLLFAKTIENKSLIFYFIMKLVG
jgi:hypothetical protein